MNPIGGSCAKSHLLNLLQRQRFTNFKSFKQIQAQLVTSGFLQDTVVISKIIDFLRISSHLVYAHEILNHVHDPNTFLFNSLISAYASSKSPETGIMVYKQMARRGLSPDMFTFPVVLKSCSKFLGIREGTQAHGVTFKTGFVCDLFVQNALVYVYAICGERVCAGQVFDEISQRDVVTWTSLISGYVRGRLFGEALGLFLEMDVQPNIATLVSALVACGQIRNLQMGRGIHGLIFKRESEISLIAGNALVDMYAKCECFGEAQRVFNEMPERDRVSWTSLIVGLVQSKHSKEALDVFHHMQSSCTEPDKVTLASVLTACASLGALDSGRWVHRYMDHKGIDWDAHLGTALVDMYAKCGCIDRALDTFHRMQHKNIYSWNAMLGGLAMNGHGKEALDHFLLMERAGLRPTEVTFVAILNACSHSGFVDEGRFYFNLMRRVYNLVPQIEHYGCMIDLFGRAGLLDEAWDLIKTMPMQPDVRIWGSMLSACKACGDVELSEHILGKLSKLEFSDSGVYVLLSNIYAINDRWEDVTRLRNLMKEKGIRKAPGSSAIEVNGRTHEFLAGDGSHPQQEEIHIVLDMLTKQVKLEEHILIHMLHRGNLNNSDLHVIKL